MRFLNSRGQTLRSYQKFFADLIVEKPGVLLSIDMGLGKTATTLTAIRRLLDAGEVRRVLIVAPLRVATDTWPDEIGEWTHTRAMSFTLIRAEDDDPEVVAATKDAYDREMTALKAASEQRYQDALDLGMTKKDARRFANAGHGVPSSIAGKVAQRVQTETKRLIRERLAQQDTDIHIINRENIQWLWQFWGKRWPYDMVVYDESSRLKAGRKRTAGKKTEDGKKCAQNLSEFGSLCMARPYISRVVELTGTPSPNGVQDLWGQAYFIDRGQRLGTSRTAFEQRWFNKDYLGFNLEPRPGAEAEIMERMSDIMFSLRAEDHIDLPPVIYNTVPVTLPPKMLKDYREFEKTCVSDVHDVEACSRGVLTNKLLQWANGSMYRNVEGDGPKRREIVHIHDLKLDALSSVLEEAAGRSVMVAYSFKFDLERIKRRFPKAVIFDEDPDAVKKWNAGKIKLLLSHPASIGHGLNMQFGGHIACWFGLTWSLELYQQFNKRLPRPGQSAEHVYIHHIVARGTADEDVMGAMAVKGATQDSVTSAVRARICPT